MADSWYSNTLTVVAIPGDENVESEARRLREQLCHPAPLAERAYGPAREQTYCAECRGPANAATLIDLLGEQSEVSDIIARARSGDAGDAFYGAVFGGYLPDDQTLARWVIDSLRAVRPPGGSARGAAQLHLLVLLTCPNPSRGQPPFPEGADLFISPPATPGELLIVADEAVHDLWPDAGSDEVGYLRGCLLDMASGRLADLSAAIETIGYRWPTLADIEQQSTLRWLPDDPPVVSAGEILTRLGIRPGIIPEHAQDDRWRRNLWAAGLWRPPADDWFTGLTSRAWAALEGSGNPLAYERAGLDILDQCLVIERLCRTILQRWSRAPANRRADLARIIHERPGLAARSSQSGQPG